jgi:hypothetical protein
MRHYETERYFMYIQNDELVSQCKVNTAAVYQRQIQDFFAGSVNKFFTRPEKNTYM